MQPTDFQRREGSITRKDLRTMPNPASDTEITHLSSVPGLEKYEDSFVTLGALKFE